MPKRLIYLSLLFFLNCYCCISPVLSQIVAGKRYDNISFTKIQNCDFLQYGTIESIIQDDKGFMWIATKDGLGRYDSHEIKIYRPDNNNANSISHNIITCLFKDSQGTIWAGTPEGLNRYNYKKDNFDFFRLFPAHERELRNNNIYKMAESADGKIWIVTYTDGIAIYDPESNSFTNIMHQPGIDNGLSSNNLRTILIDSKQNIWVGTRDKGVDVLDYKNNRWRHYSSDSADPFSLPNNDIRSIFEDSNGEIWIGTHGAGLARFNQANNNFKVYRSNPDQINSLASNVIWDIFEDSNKNILVCTQDGGLSLYLRGSDSFYNYLNDRTDPQSISGNVVRSIYEDTAGNLWLGLFNEGLNFINAHQKAFNVIKSNPTKPNTLSNNQVSSVLKDREGILWIGTDGGGLNRYDATKNEFKLLKNDKHDPHSLSNDKPISLAEDIAGNIWAGVYDGGLNLINKKTLKVKRFFSRENSKSPIYHVWSLLADSNKIWVGTNLGLYTIDIKTYQTKAFSFNVRDHKGTNNGEIWKIYKDSKNRILLATSSGLNVYHPDKDRFDYYEHDPNDSITISKNWITAFLEDSKKRIWIGTNGGGLNLWHEQTDTFEPFNTNNGLVNNNVFGILEDSLNNLWISTNNGLVKYNYEKNLFHNYDLNDGLQGNHFLPSSFMDKDGWMYFGGISGLTYFNPSKIKENSFIPPIVLTNFKLFNKEVDINQEDSPLHENIVIAKSLQLDYNHSFFSFNYSALNYSIPQRNRYKYKLEGFNDDWIDANNEHSVTFTNLNPGQYKFVVIGSNNDNVWNEEGASIDIVVKSPFYLSWTFIFGIVLLIMLIASSIYYYRITAVKKINSRLEAMVRRRTSQLQERNEEISIQKEELRQQRDIANDQYVKIFKQRAELEMHRSNLETLVAQRTKDLVEAKVKAEESDKLKSAFLANMSHEIRTPMNAVSGFINLLKNKSFTEKEKLHFMKVIENSHQVLLRLIDDIISLAKIESGGMNVAPTKVYLQDFLSEMNSIYYSQFVEKPKVKFVVENTLSPNTILFTDGIRLNQIISNLLNNAIKFTEEGTVRLSATQKSDQIIFSVEDTGIGISEENTEKIFERFYKIEDDSSRLYSGTGLGLAIAKSLSELLGGVLSVKSEIGKGTQFTLALPTSIISSEYEGRHSQQPDEAQSLQWASKRILIVEDEISNFRFLQFALKISCVQISHAINGKEAVDMVNKNSYDLILMDIRMPFMDGYEATKKIKRVYPHLPIIAQTAYSGGTEREAYFNAGFDDYITKPINTNHLFDVLKKYLG
ncbi:Signal transduction histidine kinase [Saccharicrinis carchari]|uniref:histidine kinase n=1 Tax=Saccharicrinis carchari TaxID=1168039 RepID=A0A521AZV0_SACCC|nr:hybrid sensor histidine kinase/response regulator [Saccharicrinis carchari]SMO40301.1 Signal transduction histidine kinase [Saccharicrinis carchari]